MDPRPLRRPVPPPAAPPPEPPPEVPFEGRVAAAEEIGRRCAICQTGVSEGERIGACPACAASYHEECWTENGGCAVYGCSRTPQTVKDENAAGPPKYFWGLETKQCPNCGNTIKVAAIYCRFCKTGFETAAPISRAEMNRKQQKNAEAHSLKGSTVTLFVCGIIPCVAPLTLLVGGIWFLQKRAQIAKLPGLNRAFCTVGLIASLVCTLMLILIAILT